MRVFVLLRSQDDTRKPSIYRFRHCDKRSGVPGATALLSVWWVTFASESEGGCDLGISVLPILEMCRL